MHRAYNKVSPNQMLKPSVTVVVDDGSNDNTSGVARSLRARVVRLDRRSKAPATGTPYLAYIVNGGLKVLEEENVSFVMISGAECAYPRDYLYKLVQRMIRDRVVLASESLRGSARPILAYGALAGLSWRAGLEEWGLGTLLTMVLRLGL